MTVYAIGRMARARFEFDARSLMRGTRVTPREPEVAERG
jgi:hypothetical protein